MKTVLLITACLSLGCVAGRQSSVEHGSLVVAMPVASGWVVCGDRRRTSSLSAGGDDEVKVFELAGGVVAGMTGLRRVSEPGITFFDVADSVTMFASTHRFDGRDDYAERLGKALGADFLSSVPRRVWPEVERLEDEGPSVFTVMLFWVTKGGLPQWADVTFSLRGGPRYAARSTREVVASTNSLRTVTFGNLAVIEELEHGRLPAFEDARKDADVRQFLLAPYRWRERMAVDAERFGRRVIELTSARLPELERKASNVGPVADCVRVSQPLG